MNDWDTRILELKKNIDEARKRYVFPFLDSSDLATQVPDKANTEKKQLSDDLIVQNEENTNSKIDRLTSEEITGSLDKVAKNFNKTSSG